jgi:cytidylate kinase
MAIITISREMGSGGIPIANEAAEKLGYTLVDGEAIAKVAPEYGLTPEALENADEKPPAFVEKLDEKSELDLHLIELIVLEYALKGNVIIYGRGGQDLLKGVNSVFRVRIIAPFEDRIERWAEREWLDPDLARALVRRSDQQRAGFIKYFFDRDWSDPLGYDLTINTERMSEETAVKLICDGVKDKHLVEQKGSAKKILSDLIIRKRVEIAILSLPDHDGNHIAIDVCEGDVTLGGHVHSDEAKHFVVSAAAEAKGVKKVVDKIRRVEYRNFPQDH